jgi:hypothetical protein
LYNIGKLSLSVEMLTPRPYRTLARNRLARTLFCACRSQEFIPENPGKLAAGKFAVQEERRSTRWKTSRHKTSRTRF